LEDKLRTIFIQSEDATLEGFAGELETQLAQLRLIGGEIKDIPLEFNGECSELFVTWNKTIKTLLYNGFNAESWSTLAVSESNREMPGTLLSISLLTGSFLKAKSYKMSLRESCSKLLSVISMVMGKWETKIEDRIDLEELNEGLVMSGGMVIFDGKKKTSRGKKHNHSSIYY